MAHHGKRGWLLALGILTLCVAPAAAGPADKPGIDGRIPEPPSCHVLRDVLWPPSNRFIDIQFHAQTEPDNRIFTFIYSNTFPSRRGDALTGWNASLSLRAALKRRGPTYPPEARVYLIVVAANSPMGGWAYSTCTVVVPVNPGLTALEEARAKARAAEHSFHEIGAVPDGYYPVLESNSLESLPTVTITASDPTASEAGPDDGVFTVTRTAPSGDTSGDFWPPLTVYYQRSGTAEQDIQPLSGSVTILGGQSSATIPVSVMDDGEAEGPETVTLTLAPDAAYDIGSPGQATLNIEDNDLPATVTIAASNTPENLLGPGAFTITRDGDLTWPLKVYHEGFSGTAGSGDYTVDFFGSWGSGYWEIPAGDPSITIYILPVDDTEIEGPETVIHTLSANSQYELGTPSATVTIEDDDFPIVRFSSSTYQVSENGGEATITVTLSAASSLTTTVDYGMTDGTASNGSDYTRVSGTLTFAPGETSKTFSVPILNDTVKEVDETVTLILLNPTNAVLEDPPTAELTITDDGDATPSVQFDGSLYHALEEPNGVVTITLTLSAATDQAVTVDYATSDGSALADSDYTAASGTLTFAPGETTKTFTVSLLDDSAYESNEFVNLTFSNASNATLPDPPSARILIIDDDPMPTVQFDTATYNASESAGAVPLHVTLSVAAGTTVTVDYLTIDHTAIAGNDYAEASGTLTFAPGETMKEFTVSVLNDTIKEPSEDLYVILADAHNAGLGEPAQLVFTIVDDDTVPSVQFVATDFHAWEEESSAKITVTLSAPSDQEIRVYYKTTDGSATAGSDYTYTDSSVLFSPGEASKSFNIGVANDGVNEPNEYLTLTLRLVANPDADPPEPPPTNVVLGPIPTSTVMLLDKSAFVITDLYNTGVKDDATPKKGPLGTGLLPLGEKDLHYTLTQPPGMEAKTADNDNWLADPGRSKWLAPDGKGTETWPRGATFVWTTHFNVPADVRSRLVITGKWMADDYGFMRLNGKDTGNRIANRFPNTSSFEEWHSFTIAGGFQEGDNTLEFVVTNALASSGVRVEFTGAVEAETLDGLAILDDKDNLITAKVTTIVGKKTKLKRKLPPEFKYSSQRWAIPGQFVKSYTQKMQKGWWESHSQSELEAHEISYYWIDGEANREVQYTVVAAGKAYIATAKFDVNRPTAKLDGKTTTVDPPIAVGDRGDGKFGLHFGVLNDPKGVEWPRGITFVAEATVPDNGTGKIAITQLVKTDRRWEGVDKGKPYKRGVTSDGSFVLDGAFGIQIAGTTSIANGKTASHTPVQGKPVHDVPSQGVLSTTSSISINEEFETYLMYKPDGVDSIWVTLRLLKWNWSASATKDGKWKVDGTYSKNPGSQNDTMLPRWTDYFDNLPTIDYK